MLRHKEGLNKFQRHERVHRMFTNQSVINQEIKHNKISIRHILKFRNTYLGDPW